MTCEPKATSATDEKGHSKQLKGKEKEDAHRRFLTIVRTSKRRYRWF